MQKERMFEQSKVVYYVDYFNAKVLKVRYYFYDNKEISHHGAHHVLDKENRYGDTVKDFIFPNDENEDLTNYIFENCIDAYKKLIEHEQSMVDKHLSNIYKLKSKMHI